MIAAVVLLLSLSSVLALNVVVSDQSRVVKSSQPSSKLQVQTSKAPRADITCDSCVDFFDEFLNTLLNAALQVGVAGTCEELCSYIPNQYGQVFCSLVCLGVGLDEFINFLNDADLDPIYLCAELDACTRDTCGSTGCTTITNVVVSPNPGKLRSTFTFSVHLRANKQTGTGITGIAMNCPNCNQDGQIFWGSLNEGFAAGQNYILNTTLDTAEMDWTFPIGQVQFHAVSCRYDCGDGSNNKQHGFVWSDWNGTFVIKQ